MNLKGVILAGGTGSRLMPLTKVTNKHLLPVGEKPMIYYPVEKLVGAGIKEILIVTGTDHMGDMVNLLGSGSTFGCRFTYKVQDEAGGIAQALSLAENFCHGDPMAVILGDNIFEDPLGRYAESFIAQGKGARILGKTVNDPERFGVAEVSRDGTVLSIEEKPAKPKSNIAVTGVYFYDAEVFNIIRNCKPSARGELEITDVNNSYIRNRSMMFDMMKGWWSDAGTFGSLATVNRFVLDKPPHS